MIVDDEVIRVGSSNMNNRSLGLDTECDLFIDAARPGNAHAAPAIRKLRLSLLAEHCAIPIAQAEAELNKHGSMAAMIAAQSTVGNHLQPFALRPLSEGEKAVADNALLDPERPEHLFDPFARHRGLFRLGGFLRRPK
jgi:phosphatidylserine/phosphatidylglycerophosphate/cardiolipin synthase-like enzyme